MTSASNASVIFLSRTGDAAPIAPASCVIDPRLTRTEAYRSLKDLAGTAMAQEVVVEYWHPYGPPFDATQEETARLFNERYKGRIRVEVKAVPDLYEKLPAAIAAGVGPDAAHVTGIARVIEYADEGLIQPLDPLLARHAEWNPQDMFPGFYQSYRYNGQLYGLPMSAQPTSLVWSKQAFLEAGLDPERGPESQLELETYIRRLTRKNPDNTLARLGFLNTMWGGMTNFAYHWGASLFDKADNRITVTDEPAVEAFEWMVNLYDSYGGAGAVSQFVSNFKSNVSSGVFTHLYSDPLYAGTQGMATYSHYHYYVAHTNAPDWEFGFGKIPPLGQPTAQAKAPIVHTDGEAVMDGANHPYEAALFIHFKTLDPVAQRETIQNSAHPSASISVNRKVTFEGGPEWYPTGLWMQNFEVLEQARPWPETPIVNDITREFNAAYSRALQGSMAPRPSLEQAQQVLEAQLAERKAQE